MENYGKKLKTLETIKKEFQKVSFNKERFTKKEYDKYFKGKKIATLSYLKDLEIVKIIDTEKFEIQVEDSVFTAKKYYYSYNINVLEEKAENVKNDYSDYLYDKITDLENKLEIFRNKYKNINK